MTYLYQALSEKIDAWRAANYPCDDFPAIREILEFATEDAEAGQLRYLRRAQFRALETYWYLRLGLGTRVKYFHQTNLETKSSGKERLREAIRTFSIIFMTPSCFTRTEIILASMSSTRHMSRSTLTVIFLQRI